MFNAEGGRCPLRIDCIELTTSISIPSIDAPKRKLLIRHGFGAWFDPLQKLMGGPVMNEAEEVIGVAIGSTNRGFLIAQPWVSVVSNCIEMEVEVSQ